MITWGCIENAKDIYGFFGRARTPNDYRRALEEVFKQFLFYKKVLLIRDFEDWLPHEVTPASAHLVSAIEDTFPSILRNWEIAVNLGSPLSDYGAVIITRCAPDDPEYLAIREKITAEMTSKEIADAATAAFADPQNAYFAEWAYDVRYYNVREDVTRALDKVARECGKGWFDVDEPDAIFLGLCECPESRDAKQAMKFLNNFNVSFSSLLLTDAGIAWTKSLPRLSVLETIRQAWIDRIDDVPGILESVDPQDMVGIRKLITEFGWTEIEEPLAAGVPLEDILV